MKILEVSKEDVRRFLIRYHNMDGCEKLEGIEGVRTIMDRIRSIQYDPLNVVGRNADLVLQARVAGYRPQMLYQMLYEEHSLVDGGDKEMCIYKAEDFPKFARVRKAGADSAILTLTYRNQLDALDILDEVRDFIKINGATGAKDLSIGEVRKSRWGPKKLSSAALDYLFHTGELCVACKKGTQKYFDLRERVLSKENSMDFEFESEEDFLDWYVERRVSSVGMIWDKNGGAWQGHFLSDHKAKCAALDRLTVQGKLQRISVKGIDSSFYVNQKNMGYFEKREAEPNAGFVAPLDNILWDRKMAEAIFDFSYRWEVYTPVVKRKYGYYVIPVRYGNRFVARFEPEPWGKEKHLVIKNWWWEPEVKVTDRMRNEIEKAITGFEESFNNHLT